MARNSYILLNILIFSLFHQSVQAVDPSMVPSTHPYRVGTFTFNNITNSTYYITYDVAFASSMTIMPALFSFAALQYNNIVSTKVWLEINPTNYSSSSKTNFYFKLTAEANLTYVAVMFKFFVSRANDDKLFTTYLYISPSQGTMVENNTNTNQTVTYEQEMLPEYDAAAANANCAALDVVCALRKVALSVVNAIAVVSSDQGIGKALYGGDNSSGQYTTIKTYVFFNKLSFTYTGPWHIKVSSNSNNLNNLQLNVTYSSTMSNVNFNCSIILYNVSSPSPTGFKFYMTYVEYNGSFLTKYYFYDNNLSAANLFIGTSSIGILNGSKCQFMLNWGSSSFLAFYSEQSYKEYIFQIFGFVMTQSCSDPSYPYTFIITQTCVSSCPAGLYANATNYCNLCVSPCYTCSSATTCLSCSASSNRVLVNSQCVFCGVGTFKNGSVCSLCSVGCLTCTSQTNCSSCDSNLSMILQNYQCVTCPLEKYFNNTSVSCQICEYGCTSCLSLAVCLTCDNINYYYLQNTSCLLCNSSGKFFNSSTNTCDDCSYGCLNCSSSSICIQCDSSLKLILSNSYACVQCSDGTYYNTSEKQCSVCPYGCLTCKSLINCTSCDESLELTLIDYQCVNCSDPDYSIICPASKVKCLYPEMMVTDAKYCEFVYVQDVEIDFQYNIMTICSTFNISEHGSINTISQSYNLILYLNFQQISYRNYRVDDIKNQICVDYSYNQSFTKQKLEVLFTNTSNTGSIINPSYSQIITGAFLPYVQKQILTVFGQIIDTIMENSGSGFSVMAASFSISLFVGFIEFIEITSLYMYLNAPIPYNLQKLFQNLMSAQQFSLLPFDIPNPMQNNSLQIKGAQIYQQYDVDLYFFRGSCTMIFETFVLICIYALLFIIIKNIKCKNVGFKFVSVRMVNRFYANCVVCIQSIQIMVVFSGAAALTSKYFRNTETAFNYSVASLFAFFAFTLPLLNTVFLVKYKKNSEIDTKDAYPTIQRNRKGAELYTALRLLGLLSSAMMIPLLPYVYTVTTVIICLVLQLCLLFRTNLFKYRVMCWFRILHTMFFMLFNLMYVIFWIVSNHYPDLDVDDFIKMGNVSIVSLFGVYMLDLLQTIVDIGDILYENISKLFCKKKKQLEEQNKQDTQVKLNLNLKNRPRKGIIEPNAITLQQSGNLQQNAFFLNLHSNSTSHKIKYNSQKDINGNTNKEHRRFAFEGRQNTESQKVDTRLETDMPLMNPNRTFGFRNQTQTALEVNTTRRVRGHERLNKFKTDEIPKKTKRKVNREKVYDAAMELKNQIFRQNRNKENE